jgi:tetratricopeptide (TPR) repeat protein
LNSAALLTESALSLNNLDEALLELNGLLKGAGGEVDSIQTYHLMHMSELLLHAGDYTALEAVLEQLTSPTQQDRLPHLSRMALLELARGRLDAGNLAGAQEALARAELLAPADGNRDTGLMEAVVRGRLLHLQSRFDDALDWLMPLLLEPSTPLLDAFGTSFLEACLAAVEAACAAGRFELVETLDERLQAIAPELLAGATPHLFWWIRRRVLQAQGQDRDAQQAIHRARTCLLERAQHIKDERLRSLQLHQRPLHRLILGLEAPQSPDASSQEASSPEASSIGASSPQPTPELTTCPPL